MTAKHRKPRRSTGRNLAATAAVLTAGALPLAAAGSAFAADAPASSQLTALPLDAAPLAAPPLALAQTAPLRNAMPLAGTVTGDVATSVASGQVPVGGLFGPGTPAMHAQEAALDREAAIESADLGTKAAAVAGKVSAMLPASDLMEQIAPAMAGDPMPATVMQDGAVSTLANNIGARALGRATVLTDQVAEQAAPVAQQLRASGVPTVSDMTTSVSGTQMPVFGTLGGFTSTIPATQMLGEDSPVLGTVGAAGGL
ncbi:MAG TPA: hypothetical protein VH372_26590 [Actinospica sp.]|jgi:hypothetical protein|nr:hypothetical protein [Actinospica sp.]